MVFCYSCLSRLGQYPLNFFRESLNSPEITGEQSAGSLAVSPQRLHALLTVRHVNGSDLHTALEVESASLSQLHNCTILTSECSASNTQLPQKVSCPFDGSEKKKFAFQGLFKDGLYHNHSFSYSRKALTATQGLCEDKVIRWFAELRSKLRDDHSLPRILLIKHLHWIK